MDALCRELGVRGRADAVAASSPAVATSTEQSGAASQLSKMKLSILKKRALAAGADPQAIEEADDAEIPKDAVVGMILALEGLQPSAVSEEQHALRVELEGTKLSLLKRRALGLGVAPEVLEAADDEEEPKQAVVELVLRASAA